MIKFVAVFGGIVIIAMLCLFVLVWAISKGQR